MVSLVFVAGASVVISGADSIAVADLARQHVVDVVGENFYSAYMEPAGHVAELRSTDDHEQWIVWFKIVVPELDNASCRASVLFDAGPRLSLVGSSGLLDARGPLFGPPVVGAKQAIKAAHGAGLGSNTPLVVRFGVCGEQLVWEVCEVPPTDFRIAGEGCIVVSTATGEVLDIACGGLEMQSL
jgi:hypothetical protein